MIAKTAYSLSLLYGRMNMGEKAVKFAKLNIINQDNPNVAYRDFLILGEAYYKVSQYDSASIFLNKSLYSDDNYTKAGAYMRLADIAQKQGNLEKALEMERKYSAHLDSAQQKQQSAAIVTTEKNILIQHKQSEFKTNLGQLYYYIITGTAFFLALFLVLLKCYKKKVIYYKQKEIEMGEKIAKLKDKSLIVMNQKQAVKELLFDRKIQNYVWNKLYKRKLFQGVYFPIGVIYEDISVMYDLIRKIEKLVYLPESKYNYYIRKDSIVNTNSHQKRVDELDSVIKRYKDAKRDFPELEQENAYALVMWMIRVYSYTVKENDPNDTFIKEQYELFQSESQKYLCYILTNLKPFKRMILLAMLWDLEKGKEVVRMDGELHE